MPQDERELIERCQSGDIDCFGKLFQLFRGKAYAIALAMVGNREDALDIVQDAFIRAFKNIKRFNPERSFSSWFLRILINLCIDRLRQRKRRGKEFSMQDYNLQERLRAEDSSYSPELLAVQKEMHIFVWRAIAQLEPKHRQIIVLRDFQDLPYSKIAEILNIPLGTVMSRLYQARKKLRKAMEKYL